MKRIVLIIRPFCIVLLSVVAVLSMSSFRSMSGIPSRYMLTQISPYEKQKIQGYLDKAWACYLKKDYDTACKMLYSSIQELENKNLRIKYDYYFEIAEVCVMSVGPE